MKWHVMLQDQGQIVEYSYALVGDWLYQRVEDRSDRSVKFYRAEYDRDAAPSDHCDLPPRDAWEPCGHPDDEGNA